MVEQLVESGQFLQADIPGQLLEISVFGRVLKGGKLYGALVGVSRNVDGGNGAQY